MDLLDWQDETFPEWGLECDEIQEIYYESENPNDFTLKKLFPIIYSKDPVSGGKFIERGLMNGILRALSTMVHHHGISRGSMPFNEKYCADRGYPLGARVLCLYDSLTGQLTTPTALKEAAAINNLSYEERRAFCDTLTIESLRDKNQDSPLVLSNLFKTWRVVDGRSFGDLLYRGVNLSDNTYTPPGYLDLGYSPPEGEEDMLFDLKDYPRVAAFLKAPKASECSYFRLHGQDKFKITNLTGLFARVFNNNFMKTNLVPRDVGRVFNEIQEDASCPITGAVALLGYYGSGGAAYGSLEHQLVRASVWMPVTELSENLAADPKYAHFKDLSKHNAFKPIKLPTNYMVQNQSYLKNCYSYTTFSDEGINQFTGHVLTLDTSDHPKTSHEVRPKNFAVKLYIKV